MRISSFSLLAALVMAPHLCQCQSVVFSDNFSASTLNPTTTSPGNLTATGTAYEIASSKNATGTTISGNGLTLSTSSTSSGFTEAQAMFTAAPITLSAAGQYVEFYCTFKDTANVLNASAGNNSGLYLGLFNSGGNGPTNGTALWNGGISGSSNSATLGGAQNWVGYAASFVWSSNALEAATIATRPAQNQGDNLNQELLFASSYAGHTNVNTLAGVLGEPLLTSGSYYTLALQISYVSASSLGITAVLYNGAGTNGAVVSGGGFTAIYSGNATGATAGTSSGPSFTFDSLAIGYRAGAPAATTVPITNITVVQFVPSAPNINGLTNETVVAGTSPVLSPVIGGQPAPALQWRTNGVNFANVTTPTLTLTNVQYAQNGYMYSLVATNLSGSVTSSMTLSVIVPPGITGLNPQAAGVGSTVTISPTVSGVPPPVCQWAFNGTNLVDQTDVDGSVISGSATSTLNITNAQIGEAGTYWLIASNSAGVVSNSMLLSVGGNSPPLLTGPTNLTVIQGNNATFTAAVSGVPQPVLQWLDQTGTPIPGATNDALILPNVQYSQNGFVYSLVASNSVSSVTNNATLTVLVAPVITSQPVNLTVTNTQSASFTVAATGQPNPAYQWFSNNVPISGSVNSSATNATFILASVSPSSSGSIYQAQISNTAGSTNSASVTLTVNSTMGIAVLKPANGAAGVCYDTPLYVTFTQTPVINSTGMIRIYNATNSATPVDTIDLSLSVTNGSTGSAANIAINVQPRTIAGETFTNFPVLITGNQAAIYPHLNLLTSNQTYYVTIDNGAFKDSAGANFAGITDSNAWRFTTKAGGPANPLNLMVAQDNSGDFVTVQGAVDSAPAGNTTPRTINIGNGTYTEIVDIHSKNNLLFRGQSRSGTVVGYPNNANLQGSTHFRMAFKVNGNDIALDNLTVTNMTPVGGSQAEAIMIETGAARFILNNANVGSYQDTLLANTDTSQGYFYNSLIEGQFDYIWGGGNLFFTNCELRTLLGFAGATSGGNLTASRTGNGATGNWLGYYSLYSSNGFSFTSCRLTRANGSITSTTLADSNGTTNGNVAWINCSIDANYITPAAAVLNSQLLWEYGNSNLNDSATASYGLGVGDSAPELTSSDPRYLAASSATTWLNGWVPALSPNITSQPSGQTAGAGQSASFSVSATGIPDPAYQWLQNGMPISGATFPTFNIPSASHTNAGNYSVVVSNPSGSVTSFVAVLTYSNTPPVAGPASYTRNAAVPQLNISISNLLANATDVDGDPVTLVSVGVSTNGVTPVISGGYVIYYNTNPAPDQFTYTVTDGFGGTNTGLVTVNVSNQPLFGQATPAISTTGGSVMLDFAGIPGYSYSVDRSTNADFIPFDAIWTTNAPPSGVFQFIDAAPPQPAAYYRLQYNP